MAGALPSSPQRAVCTQRLRNQQGARWHLTARVADLNPALHLHSSIRLLDRGLRRPAKNALARQEGSRRRSAPAPAGYRQKSGDKRAQSSSIPELPPPSRMAPMARSTACGGARPGRYCQRSGQRTKLKHILRELSSGPLLRVASGREIAPHRPSHRTRHRPLASAPSEARHLAIAAFRAIFGPSSSWMPSIEVVGKAAAHGKVAEHAAQPHVFLPRLARPLELGSVPAAIVSQSPAS